MSDAEAPSHVRQQMLLESDGSKSSFGIDQLMIMMVVEIAERLIEPVAPKFWKSRASQLDRGSRTRIIV